jgi:hypothetical protein
MNSLDSIVRDARRKGFDDAEVLLLRSYWISMLSDYNRINPHFEKEPFNDYISRKYEYAAKQTRTYVTKTIDEWHKGGK